MVRALPYVVPIALALFALIDLSRSTAVERAEIHPLAWVAIIVLLPVVGPIAWIAVSRQRAAAARRAAGGTPTPGPLQRPGPARPRRTGPVAPDDDPDFLWRLEQERRRRAREAGGSAETPGDAEPPTPDDAAGEAPDEDGPAGRRGDGGSAA